MHQTASEYHHTTRYERDRMKGGGLDWTNPPRPYKIYEGHPSISLPRDIQLPDLTLQDLYDPQMKDRSIGARSIVSCGSLLYLAYGLTAKRRGLGEDFFFRSVPSAGALYPVEIYFGAWNIEGISPGLYHFDTIRHSIVPLRMGDFRKIFLTPDSNRDAENNADATFWVSGIFFRSSWKYRERAYRYVLLDAGHLIENLVLALKTFFLPSVVFLDFDDEKALLLMGFNPAKEVSIAQVVLPGSGTILKRKSLSLSTLGAEVAASSSVSTREKLFPEIIEIHRAGYTFKTGIESDRPMRDTLGLQVTHWDPIPRLENWKESLSFSQCALRRRSHRNFVPTSLNKESFARLLDLLMSAAASHRARPPFEAVLSCGLLVHTVEDLNPGFYMLDTTVRAMGLVQVGAFADPMASVCLDQEWLKNAAIHFLFMSNLGVLDLQWGARGYRYAMIAAGRLGQSVYLACSSMDVGCCGIGALYDEEAKDLLGLEPDAALLYLVAAGNVHKRY